uniref:DUF3592 domain-containing protein n=1 Tax=candidate division WOR-3 bacterium TaxID=2052148 RepID=A0A7V0Z6H5_UNCW3
MWQINKHALILVVIPFIIIGIVFIVLAINTSPEAKTGDGYPLRIFFLLMGGFYIVFIIALIGGIILWKRRQSNKLEWFKKFGIPGTAEIISAEQTGVYINNLPQVCLKMNITTGMIAPYTITIKKVYNLIEIGKLIPGAKMQVLVDPKNPKNILLL